MFKNLLDYVERQLHTGRDVGEITGEGGKWWRILLRHSATSRKVAGSIPIGALGIFH
jgi:hypothetical protein